MNAWRTRSSLHAVDGLCVAALIAGGVMLVGGILWGWGAMRGAARVAVKIVSASNSDAGEIRAIKDRLAALEPRQSGPQHAEGDGA